MLLILSVKEHEGCFLVHIQELSQMNTQLEAYVDELMRSNPRSKVVEFSRDGLRENRRVLKRMFV